MIIVGLSPIVHESAVGVLVDGKLVAAAAEERFTRVKNQGGFPHQALRYVLSEAGLAPSDVQAVAYAGLPALQERLRDLSALGTNAAYVARATDKPTHKLRHLANFARNVARGEWTSRTEERIRGHLSEHGISPDKLVHVDHHEGHVASAYYTSGFDRALVVSLDGYGSGQAGSFWLGEGGKLQLLSPIPYPHSLGTFYRRVTTALGFKANRHEGKIVGLAAFGDPSKLYDLIRARFDLDHDDYYRFKSGQDPFFERQIVSRYSREDIAAAYQRVLEEVATNFIEKWVRRTGTKHVACAGGVFANVKMNQRVMEIPGVEQIYVFPAMGDGGVGVGAAMALEASRGSLAPRRIHDVYLGPGHDDAQIERALRAASLPVARSSNVVGAIVDRLVEGKVVCHFRGRMEFGPRALGNRSILYPAKDPSVNKWLNDRLRRTEFMPFAPITLAEHADELYEDIGKCRYSAEFMTVTTNCTPLMKQQSPAAVHVDGTARPQLVRPEVNPTVHAILKEYHARTGIPTLINTSFNMHEEPIVCSPEDAVRAFLDGDLEVLVLGDYVIDRAASGLAAGAPERGAA
jgi:carbamoyltransferase